MHKSLIVLLFLYCVCQISKAEEQLLVPKPRSDFDVSHDYHIQLLNLALQKTASDSEIPSIVSTMEMSQGRVIKELLKGEMVDIYWLGTSKELEETLLPIRIPTTRGLIGYRKFIIHQDGFEKLEKVKSLNDLTQLAACQGQDWPDTEILQNAGLLVTTTTVYEDIFRMLNSKRCDYFPRGYHDAHSELNLRKHLYPNLLNYDNIMLHYPFAVYFFTNKSNQDLAKRIEQGLKLMAEKGEIEKLMRAHPLTQLVYPLKDEKNTLFFHITNPLLPAETDFHNPVYWILPQDFNIAFSAGIN